LDNICVPALEEHPNRQQMTGGYSVDSALPFNLDLLGNAILEVPDLSPREAWRLARPQVQRELGRVCKSATSADHQRDFAIQADYHQLNWTQLLLPMLTTHYQDDEGQPQVLVVNGVTGGIKGPRLASRKRGLRLAGILAAIAGAILLLALLSLALTAVFPPAGLIGALFGVIGLGVGLFAIIPAIWPGQHNRKQRDLRIIRKSS
jgi:hypothetical protein